MVPIVFLHHVIGMQSPHTTQVNCTLSIINDATSTLDACCHLELLTSLLLFLFMFFFLLFVQTHTVYIEMPYNLDHCCWFAFTTIRGRVSSSYIVCIGIHWMGQLTQIWITSTPRRSLQHLVCNGPNQPGKLVFKQELGHLSKAHPQAILSPEMSVQSSWTFECCFNYPVMYQYVTM